MAPELTEVTIENICAALGDKGLYHDEDNGRGTFMYDSAQHQISFQGAATSGQVASSASAGKFTLKSARNSVDCDRGN